MKDTIVHDIVNFGRAFRQYLRVIFAIVQREEAARRHEPLEAILSLLEPVFLIIVVTGSRYALDRFHTPPFGTSTVLFYASGFFADYLFLFVSRRMGGPIMYPHRRFPIEARLDHIIALVILRAADYSILGVIVFGWIYIFVTHDALPSNFVAIILAVTALIMLGFGWGIINIMITRIFWPWGYFGPLFYRCLFLFSGVFFLPDFLPPATRYLISLNPLCHAIILFRMGFYPQQPTLVFDPLYLAEWAFLSVAAGLILERVTRRAESP